MMTDPPRNLIVRRANSDEAPAIKSLELACGLSAWAVEDYEKSTKDPDRMLLVAVLDRDLIGFCLARLITKEINQSILTAESAGFGVGCRAETEAEIHNIAVAERWRRSGIGRSILVECFCILGESSTVSAFLEVRKSNLVAQKFYMSRGFEIEGIRANYYSDPVEDAFVMKYSALAGVNIGE